MAQIKEIKSAVSHCDIIATVKTKSDVRTYGTNGMYVNIELFDGEAIKLTLFGKEMCDKVAEIKVGSTYRFRDCRAKNANLQYGCINKNGMELLPDTKFSIADAENVQFDESFCTIYDVLESCALNSIVDVVAVMKSKDDIEYKTGVKKREILLMDGSTTTTCKLQMWNDEVEKVQFVADTVATFRRLKVRFFNGTKMLLFSKESKMDTDSVSPATCELEASKTELVVESEAPNQSQKNVLNNLHAAQEECQKIGESRLEMAGTVVAAEPFTANEWYYKGCPKLGCGKKMMKSSGDDFFCSKCDEHFSMFKHQVLLRLTVKFDGIDLETVMFNNASLKIMDMSAVQFAYREMYSKDLLVDALLSIGGEKFNFCVKLKKVQEKDELQYIIETVERISNEAIEIKAEQPDLQRNLRKRKKT